MDTFGLTVGSILSSYERHHLTFEQKIGILMLLGLTFRLSSFTRVISCNSLQPKKRQGSWKSYPTQTNAQLFTSLWSIVFGSNIKDKWRPKDTV